MLQRRGIHYIATFLFVAYIALIASLLIPSHESNKSLCSDHSDSQHFSVNDQSEESEESSSRERILEFTGRLNVFTVTHVLPAAPVRLKPECQPPTIILTDVIHFHNLDLPPPTAS